MYRVTTRQYFELVDACRKARNPGLCNYADSSGPECVVGQLAAARGVPLANLLKWMGTWVRNAPSLNFIEEDKAKLRDFPSGLLGDLQEVWDVKVTGQKANDELVAYLNGYVEIYD